jgi:excisionase family DNA binding protein
MTTVNTSTITITVSDAAKELDVRVDEIYRLVRSHRLIAKKVNGKLAINYDSLIAHMLARRGNNHG